MQSFDVAGHDLRELVTCCLQSKGGVKARACQAPGRNLQSVHLQAGPLNLGLNDCSCCDGGFSRSLVPRPEGKFRLRHGSCIAMGTNGGLEALVGLDFARRAAGSVAKVFP
jgi:hypothetical protein